MERLPIISWKKIWSSNAVAYAVNKFLCRVPPRFTIFFVCRSKIPSLRAVCHSTTLSITNPVFNPSLVPSEVSIRSAVMPFALQFFALYVWVMASSTNLSRAHLQLRSSSARIFPLTGLHSSVPFQQQTKAATLIRAPFSVSPQAQPNQRRLRHCLIVSSELFIIPPESTAQSSRIIRTGLKIWYMWPLECVRRVIGRLAFKREK